MVDSDKFVIGNIQTIKKDMETTWSGYASDELCTSLGITIQSIAKVKLQLNNFDGALALLEKYKEKKAEIDVYKGAIEDERANPSLLSTEEYLQNGKKKTITVFVVNQKLIDEYNSKIIILKEEKLAIKNRIEGILSLITGVDLQSNKNTTFSSNLKPKNNLDIAHRGHSPGGIHDNSREAFIEAGERGFWGAEADVLFDVNGNLVVEHNFGDIDSQTITIDEYLDICREYGMTAIIDLKYVTSDEKSEKYKSLGPTVVAKIEEKGMIDSCVIQTNHDDDIPNIRQSSKDVRIWMLGHNVVTDDQINKALENNVECINFNNNNPTMTYNNIEKIEAAGLDSCVWGITDTTYKNKLINKGATYIMSDDVLGITPYQEGDKDYNGIAN